MYKIMTPGPTQVKENVRMARSFPCTNPDLDETFVDFYKETCELISRLLHTGNETLILGGEGILGLEYTAEGLLISFPCMAESRFCIPWMRKIRLIRPPWKNI